jgi:drug/metabolite transporter (DMT)-like permease
MNSSKELAENESLNELNKLNDQEPSKKQSPASMTRQSADKSNKESVLGGFSLALVSEFCLAISNVFMKKTHLFTDTEQALVRYGLQFIAMFVIIRWKDERIFPSLKDDRKLFIILMVRGILGTASILFTMRSLMLIDPSDTIALVNLNVIFVAILAKYFLPNEKLNIFHLLSIPIIMIGINAFISCLKF